MQLSDLIDAGDMSRLQEARHDAYVVRAIGFLRRQFAPAVSLLSDDELGDAVRDAATETRQAGLRSERDHLNFLIVRVFLGRRFILNPLYIDLLYSAGWLEDDGCPARAFAFAPLFEEIDRLEAIRAGDLRSSRRLIARFARLYDSDAPQGAEAVASVLPATASVVRGELLAGFSAAAMAHAVEYGLQGADRSAFICVAALLGVEFHTDPFHVSVFRALTGNPPGTEMQRLAFGQELSRILQARQSTEKSDGI